jgi:DNA primase
MASGSVAEVKSRLAVADVVGETVQLKKAGNAFKGLCPFHGEKTPSFVVTPARDSWKCFGCGKGGDIFTFVMERDNLPFGEALTLLAAKAGVVLDERSRAEDVRRARLREVLEGAVSFYHAILTTHDLGKPALDYLHARGFTDATIESQRLGWAPESWDACSKALAAKRGATPEELEVVGLTTDRGGGRGAYDRFRARIIFPIRDASGKITGLGGRLLPVDDARGDHGPKYLNSAATPLFDKSRTLYLIDKAKPAIRKGGTAVLVEGYTDALMAHQSGFENVVASMGTALTPAQVALLLRYGSKIVLAYDVDAAGAKAGAFGATELLRLVTELAGTTDGPSLVDVGIVKLPDGKDPDEVVRDQPDAWRAAVERPIPVVEYLIEEAAAAHDLRDLGGRKRAVDAIKPTLRALRDPVIRDGYAAAAARRIGVDESTIREAMRRPGGEGAVGTSDGRISADRVRAADLEGDISSILAGVSAPEAELLRLLILAPAERLRMRDSLGDELFSSGLARSLWHGLRAALDATIETGASVASGEQIPAAVQGEERRLAQALLARESQPVSLERLRIGIDQTALRLEADRLEEAMAWARSEIAEAERAADVARVRELMEQGRELSSKRKVLDRRLMAAGVMTAGKGGTR